mgnify:CR=1 FL=1
MAKFPSLTFTEKGLQMLVQAQNSHTLTFTCGKLGSGALDANDDISKFTDLKAPKMTLPITKKDDSNPEKIVLTFDTSNTSLEQGFVSREFGVFAKLDSGEETLYAYSNAGNDYDFIPSKDTPSDENRLEVSLVVSSSANVNVNVDPSIVYAHVSDVNETVEKHNTSDDAHSNLFKLFAKLTDLKTHNEAEDAHENRFKLFEKIESLGDDIVKKLALTTAITAITALETGSWFGQLLKMVLTASGVKYSIAQNGYVCLGSFFGGLILQWGNTGTPSGYAAVAELPISCTILVAVGIGSNVASDTNYAKMVMRLADCDSNHQVAFRTNYEFAPSVYYIVLGT